MYKIGYHNYPYNTSHKEVTTLHKAIRLYNIDICLRHKVIGKQHKAIGTHNKVVCTRHRAVCTRHRAIGTQHKAVCTRHRAICTLTSIYAVIGIVALLHTPTITYCVYSTLQLFTFALLSD